MNTPTAFRASGLLAGAVVTTLSFAEAAYAEEKIPQRQMPHYCKLEATSAFLNKGTNLGTSGTRRRSGAASSRTVTITRAVPMGG